MKALPVFSIFFLVTDIVFCAIRIIFVIFSMIGMSQLNSNEALYLSGLLEIITGIGIVFFGLIGNIGVLLKKSSILTFCWLNVAETVASFFVGIWQATILSSSVAGGPESAGFLIGSIGSMLIRVALLICYVIAVSRAKVFLDNTFERTLGGNR